MVTTPRICAALVAALASLALSPATAAAWTIDRTGDTVIFNAVTGETNTVTVDYKVNPPTITDTMATNTGATGGCTASVDMHSANCGGLVSRVYVDLADGDDQLLIKGSGAGLFDDTDVITGGPGADTIQGSEQWEVFRVRDGAIDHVDCDAASFDGVDYVQADDNDVIAPNCDVIERPTPQRLSATVTTTSNTYDGICDSNCSLRDALKAADREGGTIALPAGDYDAGQTTALDVYNRVTLLGAGARTTTIHGLVSVWTKWPNADPALSPGVLTLSGLTLDGRLSSGGQVHSEDVAFTGGTDHPTLTGESMTLIRSIVSGGGIVAGDGFRLIDSTVSGNSGASYGGGLRLTQGTGQIRSSTIAGNHAGVADGIFVDDGAELKLANSIVSGACRGTVMSLGYNVGDASCGIGSGIGDVAGDPTLAALQDNGGPTDTMMPARSSPAIDAGDPGGCTDDANALLTTDQRGEGRAVGSRCDAGAVETNYAPSDPLQPVVTGPELPAPIVPAVVPRILSLKINPRAFHTAPRGVAIAAAARKGARVSYRLSTTGSLRVRVRPLHGTRLRTVGRVAARSRSASFVLTGRVGTRALKRGLYRLVVDLRDTHGRTSRPAGLTFRIR